MKADRDPLQQLSKRVFNSEQRLSIVQALLTDDRLVRVNEVADALGLPRSTVHNELHLLADLGTIQRLSGDRSVAFQRIDGPFWRWCEDLIVGVREMKSSSDGRATSE
ncbi:MAG: helix-turn-helix domain-containing protein [Actinomycetota bacterium]|nr:helix-turn-helix domain-containing protein [Actinomycetota bacterium]